MDAGLTRADVDGHFCAGDAPGLGGLSMADYMGLKVRHIDTNGTTSAQLAWIKVAASQHAQHNPHALLPLRITEGGRYA